MNYIKNEKGRLVCCSCERDIMEHLVLMSVVGLKTIR